MHIFTLSHGEHQHPIADNQLQRQQNISQLLQIQSWTHTTPAAEGKKGFLGRCLAGNAKSV